MKTVYNFGASHSIGWNSTTSYSKLIAEDLGYEFNNQAMAGASLQYILMKLVLVIEQIKKDDIVLIQLPTQIEASMHADPRTKKKRIFHYSSMTHLANEPESDFTYGLKFYKSMVQTKNDHALHYLINLHAIQNIIKTLPCKYFAFLDQTPKLNDIDLSYAVQLRELPYAVIDEKEFGSFAREIDDADKFGKWEDGSTDTGHYNEKVHRPWAEYIKSKL